MKAVRVKVEVALETMADVDDTTITTSSVGRVISSVEVWQVSGLLETVQIDQSHAQISNLGHSLWPRLLLLGVSPSRARSPPASPDVSRREVV